jgi:hypothetical protein
MSQFRVFIQIALIASLLLGATQSFGHDLSGEQGHALDPSLRMSGLKLHRPHEATSGVAASRLDGVLRGGGDWSASALQRNRTAPAVRGPLSGSLMRALLTPLCSGFSLVGATSSQPGNAALMAASFAPFKPKVRYSWDESFFYEESDNLPNGMPNKMVGITSWQQQIPLPASYFAGTTNPEKDTASSGYGQPNYWRLPLVPTVSTSPIAISQGNFQRGAVALAANGIAIFNPKNNRGDVSYEIGELDAYGGHCGLADDYHYHIIPTHLLSAFGGVLTNDKPVAWALDGYPIYGFLEPDGNPMATLDAEGGHDVGNGWGYHYHAIGTTATDATHPYGTPQSPYLMNAFHGNVVNYGGQVDGQPEVSAIRASGTWGYEAKAVIGASITQFKNPVALVTDGSGHLSEDTSASAVAKDDQYLMRILVAGTLYDQCWRIDRAAISKTLTVTWRMPSATPVTHTYSNNGNRLTSYTTAGSSMLKLPDTSQIADTTTTFGEDADYSINPQSFTDNNNGTVTDNVTGLMWQKTDNGESTWETALTNASTLTLGGYKDWRLPTPSELFSIFNHNNGNPAALDTTYFPSNPSGAAEYWWGSDVYGSSTTSVWCSNSGGGLGGKPKTETLTAGGTFRYSARYVRGASPTNAHNYLNNLDGTITDLDTGLMWTQVPASARTWEQALAYAEGLTLAGASDWRLPNIKELQTLTDYTLATATSATGIKPSINRTIFAKSLTGCSTTLGSGTVICADTTGLLVGMPIVDIVNAGSLYFASTIPPTVTAVTSGTAFTMSSNALKTGSGLTLKALAPPTAYWSSTSLKGDTTNAWLLETGINNSVLASNGPTRTAQGIISHEAKTSSYPVFAVRTTSVSTQIAVSQSGTALTDGVSTVGFSAAGAKAFTVQNNGVTSLIINSVSVDGTDASKFTLSNAPASDTTLAAGGSLTFNVVFGNASAGTTYTAALHVASSDPSVGAAFDAALSGNIPVITSAATTPSVVSSADSPYVTAKITIPTNKTLRSTAPVQLTYSVGSLTTGTVFSETMAKAVANPWTGTNADNAWDVVSTAGAGNVQQTSASNHTTVGSGTCALMFSKGATTAGGSQTQVTTSGSIAAAGLVGSTYPAFVEFWVQTVNAVAGYGWTFQLAPSGSDFTTRLSELAGGTHGYQSYHYDLLDTDRVSTLKMRFQFTGNGTGGPTGSNVYIDDIIVKTTTGIPPVSVAMYDDGLHGDGVAGDGVYGAQIPAQALGTTVSYSVAANYVNGSSTSLASAGSYTTTALVKIAPSFSQQPTDFRMIKGAATTLALSAQPTVAGAVDTWLLLAVGQDIPLLSGTVASGGKFSVPLRSITNSGDYFIRLSRAYSDSSSATTTDSDPFHIDVQTWDAVAASYEALLLDSNHLLNDGAVYRGILNVTITRFGYTSGRLRFNEPLPISNAPDSAFRNYTPVIRTFAAAFTPVEGNPSLMQSTPKLGIGTAAGREEMVLQLDLTTTPPTLNATVKHSVAVVYGGTSASSASVAANCPRLVTNLTSLPSTLSGVPGRYVLAADFPTDRAHVFLQACSTGRLLWSTRRFGYTGTGSTSLFVDGPTTFGANIYEAQTTPVRVASSQLVRSWLGKVHFTKSDAGSWGATINSDELSNGLELQACYLTSASGLVSYKAENSNWARIQKINFSARNGCLWSLQADSSSFLRTPTQLTLDLLNPPKSPDSPQVESLWNVTISSAGVAFCDRTFVNGVSPGLMLMRVERLSGEFSGTYVPNQENSRYRVYGVALDPVSSPSIRAAGWVEYGTAPAITSGSWTLQNKR